LQGLANARLKAELLKTGGLNEEDKSEWLLCARIGHGGDVARDKDAELQTGSMDIAS
jgi:hypothetical protein